MASWSYIERPWANEKAYFRWTCNGSSCSTHNIYPMISIAKVSRVLFIFLVLGFLYMKFRPAHVTEIYNIPFPTIQSAVKAGDILEYRVLYCRPNDYVTHTIRWVVDVDWWRRIKIGETVSNMSQTLPDCNEWTPREAITKVQIPTIATTGEKMILIESEYLINPWRTERSQSWTQNFIIE